LTSVKVVNLTKRFGEILALEGVNLEVEDGEYLAIIGPSGCGKTTLLKCLAGMHRPTKGEIYFDGRLVNDLPPEERGIGYVFQEVALFPHMTVYDNVAYSPRVKGWPKDRMLRVTGELLELTQLSTRRRSYPKELSGGAMQKTGLARALASGAGLLLLDEPLGALDAKVREVLRYEIRDLAQELGLTVIHITHDQEEAMSVADRVAVMKAGRIVEVSRPYELYSSPKTLFAANFVGEANFFEGVVVNISRDGCIVDSQGLILKSANTSMVEGEKVVVAIRPEYVSMMRGRSEEGFLGHIETWDFEGGTIRYEVALEDHRILAARLPFSSSGLAFNIGDEVTLSVLPERVLLYSYPKPGLQAEIALE
jgi:ABC-type Fe3+/spermidine/putrescine transport system ATPase subunit